MMGTDLNQPFLRAARGASSHHAPLPSPMKRVFLLILGLGLAALIGHVGWNTWQSARFFHDQGREATVVIGKRYNAERWTSPVPLKKIVSYTAKMEPAYEVLIETDQDLKDGEKLTIRFLTRDLAANLVDYSVRPVVNSLRLRGAEDGAPVKLEDTQLFDALVDKWMGPPAPGTFIRARPTAEAAPSNTKPTVPFVFAEKDAGTWDIVWANSRIQEWALIGLGIIGVHSLLFAAYDHHKDSRLKKSRGKKFVHPSLRKVEATADAPSKKLTYVPKAQEDIVLTDAEKRSRATIALPSKNQPKSNDEAPLATPEANRGDDPAAADEPLRGPIAGTGGAPAAAVKAAEEPAPLTDRETAPPMPINVGDAVLKLRRKSANGGAPEAGGDGKGPSAG
jgi:hypothetical protein